MTTRRQATGIREVVMVDYCRTPHGRASQKKPGFFNHVRGDDLAAAIIERLFQRTGLEKTMIDEITMGSPNQSGEQANPGRSVALLTCPFETRGLSVDRACTSSMAGAHFAIMAVQLGHEDIVISGGYESCSHFPIPLFTFDTDMTKMMEEAIATGAASRGMPNPRLWDIVDANAMIGMGITAENLADKYDITREMNDQWTLRSNLSAAAAEKNGWRKNEIIPTPGKLADGTEKIVDYDEDVRPDTTIERLRSLPPLYKADGKVTAASSSKQADGAGAAVFMPREKARELGLVPMCTVRSIAWSACDPAIMGYSATLASGDAVKRSGLKPEDIDLWESNGAFAVPPIVQCKVLGIPWERMNVNGDALCIGHPIGASGIRMVGTLAHEMNRRGVRYGCAAICGGFGQGTAMVVEREDYEWDGRRAWLS
ncbi:MAG: thiolase family protein [Dehalococcoidia bacterium]|nr:thiolase family protein [Dehalococcoidia bacterium]